MATEADIVKELYRRFRRQPKRLEERNLSLLVDYALDTDALDMDGERLVFCRMHPCSPFREIELQRVHGVAELADSVAVVLPNSIIFINKADLSTRAHIKPVRMPLWQRIRRLWAKKSK